MLRVSAKARGWNFPELTATTMAKAPLFSKLTGLAIRLLRNRSGNTLAMLAAALVPLLAMVGGGIDMGRSYLSQTRLQQACDSAVLAARKKLGSEFVVTGVIPDEVDTVGRRFFNLNFSNGSYGTANRTFQMNLEGDNSISGVATVDVPTTIMAIFGYSNVGVQVDCAAKLNFSNTDIMFVLDTTGSMASPADPDGTDTTPKIDALRATVKSFHAQIEGSKASDTRVRYGFLPYATNVNVAGLLKSDWMVDRWTYQSRVPKQTGSYTATYYYVNTTVLSGTATAISTTAASCPVRDVTSTTSPQVEVSASPHIFYVDRTRDGDNPVCTEIDGVFTVTGTSYDNYIFRETWTFAYSAPYYYYNYEYKPIEYDVKSLKDVDGDAPPVLGSIKAQIDGSPYSSEPILYDIENNGCIEERDTYEIDDYDNVDFSRALDLDIDLVPTAGNPGTQWRPMLPELIYERELDDAGYGSFNTAPVTSGLNYFSPSWAGIVACPTAARKLEEMDASEVASYVDNLVVDGDTYHDIGMIWGARMLSPTGLFAAENADVASKPTSRHLIFLTDGETKTYDVSYGTYGVDGLDQRRWRSTAESGMSLDEVVENRFGVACDEAKKRNITIWVIGFGITLNPIMKTCAGAGHHFEAKDATALADVFSKIAGQMGDLRVSK